MEKFLNKLKDKKGVNTLELVIGSLGLIVLLAGMCDFIIIQGRMQAITPTMNYMLRTLSNQGCLSNNPELTCVSDEYGANTYNRDYVKNGNYVTTTEFYNTVESIMSAEGIDNTEWTVKIDGVTLNPDTTTKLYDFRKRIPVTLEVRYSWNTVSSFLPTNSNLVSGDFVSSQETVSMYKIRHNDSNIGLEYGN